MLQPPPTGSLSYAAEPRAWEESVSAADAASKMEKAVCPPIYQNLKSLFSPIFICTCLSTQIACTPITYSLELLFAVHLLPSFKKVTHK